MHKFFQIINRFLNSFKDSNVFFSFNYFFEAKVIELVENFNSKVKKHSPKSSQEENILDSLLTHNYFRLLNPLLILQFLILFFGLHSSVSAQENYPQNDFRSPLDIPLYLSGTFGEPRNTHFHAGLDIKTGGVEGKNIYAIADGYISRIKASAWGYGNTLYVTHTNGYTSVYAHLSKFDDKIAKWLKQQQEANTIFEINLDSLDASLFPVKQGEIIAKSGNTGGSHGPHLHFEIRDSLERPINPFLFGFDIRVKDNVKPGLYNLVLYNLSSDRHFSNSKNIKLSGSAGKYLLSETIKVNKDEVGFGINTTDKFTDVHNHNGVYDIKMYFDGELLYHYQMNRFRFDEGKYVLSHCDYWLKRNNKQTVHKCFVEQGNQLEAYNYLNNEGKVFLYDYALHNVKIEVTDFHKNKSTLDFKVQRDDNATTFKDSEPKFDDILVQGQANLYKNEDISLDMEEDVLFDHLYLNVKKVARSSISDGFHIGDVTKPAFTWFNITLKTKQLQEDLKDKYVVAFKNYKNRVKSLGGTFCDETQTICATTRDFGYYYVTLDTIPPVITSLSVSEGKDMSKYKAIQFKMSDNLSGIDEFDLFINGTWAVLELDGKKSLYTYKIDNKVVKGKNHLLLVVKDERNNASTFSAEFDY